MTGGNLLTMALLKRKAVVYVRQSTAQQVHANLESQRRQYELVDVARRWGFRNVEVIDEDLGRSASGAVERPGFERLVDDLCTGLVGEGYRSACNTGGEWLIMAEAATKFGVTNHKIRRVVEPSQCARVHQSRAFEQNFL